MSMDNYVITIDRKLGSRGIFTGQKIASEFGFRYLDKEILTRSAEIFHISPEKLKELDEKALSLWETFLQTNEYDTPNLPSYVNRPTGRRVFEVQSSIITKAVQTSSCVIVGRCGNAIFKNYPKHIGVFLHGDREFRIVNAAKFLGISVEDADRIIDRMDKDRARYYNTYAGYNWTDVSNYELAIDVGKVGAEKAGEIIIDYIRSRFPELEKVEE